MSTIHSLKNQPLSTDTSYLEASQQSNVNVGGTERLISSLGGAGLTVYGLSRRDWAGVLLAALGAGLVYRGASGHSPTYQALNKNTAGSRSTNVANLPGKEGIKVRRSMTVNRSPEELYAFWKQVEKAPLYMSHVESVMKTGERTSHWLAAGPFGKTIEWNAEIVRDEPDKLIAWHAHGKTPDADSGQVTFERNTGDRGTVVTLEMNYYGRTPLAKTMNALGKAIPEHGVLEILRSFKELMEAGEVATVKGQPTGKGRK